MTAGVVEILPFGATEADSWPIIAERPCEGTCGRTLRIRSEQRNRIRRCPDCQQQHARRAKAEWMRENRKARKQEREAQERIACEVQNIAALAATVGLTFDSLAEMRRAYPALRTLAQLLLTQAPNTYLHLRRRLSAEEQRVIEQVARPEGAAA